MVRLRVKPAECNYKENNRYLKEQFINRINDNMTAEITKRLTVKKDMSIITCNRVLLWAKQIEVQISDTTMFESLKESRTLTQLTKRKTKILQSKGR